MKTEERMIELHPNYDKTEGIEPLWIVEAVELIDKIVCLEPLEVQRLFDVESDFGRKLASYQEFEARVMQRGQAVMDASPVLARYQVSCHEQAMSIRVLGQVALFMYYQSLGLLKSPTELKRAFFSGLFAELEDTEDTAKLDDFASFYRTAVGQLDEGNDLMLVLDFHMHFAERFQECQGLIRQLADLIRQEAKKIRFLWDKCDVTELLDQTNQLMADHVLAVNYSIRHVFPSLIYPNRAGIRDNQLDHPLLFVGVLAYDMMGLPEKKQPLEWKTSLLKMLGDPVRYQILLKSKQRPVYLSELARELNLKPSTVSHHLNALNNEKLLVCDVSDKESRKQYYTLNHDTIAQLLAEVSELL